MAHCYTGSILHVDLTSGKLWVENPPEAFYRAYAGGSAMGLYYILKETPPHADPLGPANTLTLFSGLPTGLAIAGQARLAANARSPISGGIGDSQCGGFFPAALKFAGFDGIVIRGQSPRPVYLYLHDGQVELRGAEHLWGKVTGDVEAQIKDELNDPRLEVLQIGPAGEKQVRFAALINMCNRANGRTGMGAVMGSKRLKAVVVKGSGKLTAADPATITRMQRAGVKNLEEIPDVKGLGINGTADVVGFQNSIGSLPAHNYNQGQFAGADTLMGDVMSRTILKERDTCYSCVVRCKRVVETEFAGQKVLPLYGGPEYETIAAMGSYCGVDDLNAVALANQLCNMYGMDTIACGATIAFAMECFENGLLSLQDTGGIELRFGNPDAVVTLVEKIARREGLGDLLAEGSARAAERLGPAAMEYLVTVKNTELPAHIPHAKKSLGLVYAVNPFGADHQSSEHDPMYEEGGSQLYYDRLALLGLTSVQAPGTMTDEKVRFAYTSEVFYSALDTYGLCQFVWGPAWQLYGPAELAELISAASGWQVGMAEIMQVGQRRLNMLRAFNAREGFTRADDRLPRKFSRALHGEGPTAGVAYAPEDLEHYKDVYYNLAGWDPASGNPTPARLAELGLEWIDLR
ncbi:aldehyde:ferredoxin oxidoreductase [Longilinea arvoryzae]|uniref:Aldehyde:ferredoxin oxidoreductase n=1 Tax=Longilinea arvoryzae TaxID=360412 RepID=A0A0S7BD43_9CHLR|nr:aldehyde ferredoxin oxidoreductase family protein [Longilinea arvoryzae]GAP15823.1 aldehyde:ferredoxin oxidoreductase [Longilinea arvoryzae]